MTQWYVIETSMTGVEEMFGPFDSIAIAANWIAKSAFPWSNNYIREIKIVEG